MLRRALGRPVDPAAAPEGGELPPGVALVEGRWMPVLGGLLSGMRHPAAAVTIGSTIVFHPGVAITQRLLRHELEHVAQWRRNPLTFPLRYTWNHFRHGYRDNPYEVAARAAEDPGGQS